MASERETRYHWLTAACCCALTAVSFGISLNCAGIFFAPVAEELKTGRGDIALYITLMNLVTGFSSPLAGRLVKRIPLRAWFLCAAVLVAGAMALWSRVTAVWQLYFLAAAQGIGNVMIGSVVVRMILKAWFASRLGLVLGIAFGFSGVAGAVLSPLLQAIVDCAGWRAAHDLSALLCALLILPGAFLLRRDPREKGLRPYYAGKAEAGKPPENVPLPVLPERNAGVPGIAALLAIGFIGPFLTGINQHMSGYATFIGLTASDGALMMAAIMIGNVLSKLLFGMLSDRKGAKTTFLVFMAVTVAGIAGLFLFFTVRPLLAASFLIGFTYSLGTLGVAQLAHAQFPAEKGDRYYAWSQVAANIGSSLSAAVIGYAFDLSGSYRAAFVLCLGLGILAWICGAAGFRKER